MLEHVPAWLGKMLQGMRAGKEKLVIADERLQAGFGRLALSSSAVAVGGRLAARFTADGEGVSPPLSWSGVPEEAMSLALVVEDPDAPTPGPLVHALIWDMDPRSGGIAEGALSSPGGAATDGNIGRNSYLSQGWLPPDPPTGHGDHHYAFQLFALSETPHLEAKPGRSEIVEAMAGRVLASGMLVAGYSREGAT